MSQKYRASAKEIPKTRWNIAAPMSSQTTKAVICRMRVRWSSVREKCWGYLPRKYPSMLIIRMKARMKYRMAAITALQYACENTWSGGTGGL